MAPPSLPTSKRVPGIAPRHSRDPSQQGGRAGTSRSWLPGALSAALSIGPQSNRQSNRAGLLKAESPSRTNWCASIPDRLRAAPVALVRQRVRALRQRLAARLVQLDARRATKVPPDLQKRRVQAVQGYRRTGERIPRPPAHRDWPYVWLDATYPETRQGGRRLGCRDTRCRSQERPAERDRRPRA